VIDALRPTPHTLAHTATLYLELCASEDLGHLEHWDQERDRYIVGHRIGVWSTLRRGQKR